MGHSKVEKALSRERIVTAASKQIRGEGLESISIADLMSQAKLTHGGFYGHFPSRSALIAAALERALAEGEAASLAATSKKGPRTIKSIVNAYLSPAHRDDAASGCAIAALAGDVGRADSKVRQAMRRQLEKTFEETRGLLGDGPDANGSAMAIWCTMVGAIMLSRVFKGDERSDAILRAARKIILELEAEAKA